MGVYLLYILKYWKSQFTNLNQICKHDIIVFDFEMFIYRCLFENIVYIYRYCICLYVHDIYIFIQTYMHVYIYIAKRYFGEVLIAREFDLHFRVAEMFSLLCNKVSQTLDI